MRIFFSLFNISHPHVRQLLLALCSVAAVVIFFILPANNTWLRHKIIDPLNDIKKERTNLDLEHRMQYRFDSNYIYSKQIARLFEQKGIEKTALVLMPPTSYFKLKNINYHVPEPVVFYYYTGLKTLWGNNSNAASASWYMHVDSGRVVIDSVANRQQLRDTIMFYKKLGIGL